MVAFVDKNVAAVFSVAKEEFRFIPFNMLFNFQPGDRVNIDGKCTDSQLLSSLLDEIKTLLSVKPSNENDVIDKPRQ